MTGAWRKTADAQIKQRKRQAFRIIFERRSGGFALTTFSSVSTLTFDDGISLLDDLRGTNGPLNTRPGQIMASISIADHKPSTGITFRYGQHGEKSTA